MVRIEKDFQLRALNTFGVDATARYFACFSTEEQLCEILDFVRQNNLRFMIMGGGANLLFTGDYDGMIIHPVSNQIDIKGEEVVANAGVIWDKLVEITVDAGLGGLENLSLIPGSVGAAPVQNIGAYGVEAKDTICWVEYMDVSDGEIYRLENKACKFGYRDSVFKHELKQTAIVMRVAFKLTREDASYSYKLDYGSLRCAVGQPSLKAVRQAVMEIRRNKLPDPSEMGSAGSFFRNPEISAEEFVKLKEKLPDIVSFDLPSGKVKISAGWLVEKAGWKGRSFGQAAVYDKQALVLVNKGNASGKDILLLSEKVRCDVKQLSGIDLLPEVIIL